MQLLVATRNKHKLKEISAILAVLGAKNFKIRGVSFLSRHTAGSLPKWLDLR